MKKITLVLALFIGSIGFMNAQNSFKSDVTPTGSATTVESLLERLEDIGTVSGNVNDYFTSREQRMLNVHFNGIQNLAPRVLTLSHSQNIEAGAGIACAAHPIDFRDNKFYRVFDMVGQFGITNGFDVDAVEFAIDAISTPSSFPIYINIYSTTTPGNFPGGTWNFIATETYDATNADALSIVNVPIVASIPAGEAMIMELILIDDGTGTNYMTTGVNGDGEDGPSWIEAADCGANVPTKFIDLGQNVGMVWNVLGDDEPGGGSVDPVVFGIDNTTATLISFDPTDPTVLTPLGASPSTDFENAGAIDPNDQGTAYVLNNTGAFYSVDLASGVYTLLGNIPGQGGQTWAGAEFDPTSGILYAISTDISQSSLFSIDIAGVSKTLIGATGIAGAISLMIDDNGDGYSHDIVSDQFYHVNLSSGVGSPVGPLGFDANFGQGGTYLPGDPGFVYLSAFDSGAFQSQWRRLNVLTGSSTLIGLFNGGDDQVAWSSATGALVGIADIALEGFSFYPNPTSGSLSLKSVKNIDIVVIYNVLGQKVLGAKIDATSSNLDISRLNVGTYIMQVSVEGKTGTYKIVKN